MVFVMMAEMKRPSTSLKLLECYVIWELIVLTVGSGRESHIQRHGRRVLWEGASGRLGVQRVFRDGGAALGGGGLGLGECGWGVGVGFMTDGMLKGWGAKGGGRESHTQGMVGGCFGWVFWGGEQVTHSSRWVLPEGASGVGSKGCFVIKGVP